MVLIAAAALCGVGGFLGGMWSLRTPRSSAASPPTPPKLDWCDGCDMVKSSESMAFDVAGLYRCATCRSKTDPIPESWPAVARLKYLVEEDSVSSSQVESITGHRLEVGEVLAGQKLIAQGSNASILVRGDVHSRAVLIAQGSNASIIIRGRVGEQVRVTAQGSNAEVIYRQAAASAKVVAQGSNARVRIS